MNEKPVWLLWYYEDLVWVYSNQEAADEDCRRLGGKPAYEVTEWAVEDKPQADPQVGS